MLKSRVFKKSVRQTAGALFCVLLLAAHGTGSASDATPTAPLLVSATSIVLSGHTGGITALAWSPDGSILASGAGAFDSTDNTARLWRADGTPLKTLTGHSAPVASLAWSPDGKTLATGGFDAKIGLWTADGNLIKMIDADAGIVFKLAWSPDGKMLASGSLLNPSSNTVQWWQPYGTAAGSLIRTRTTDFSGGKFYNLGWSPDGKYLVAGATSYTEWTADGTPVFTDEACASCTPAWGFAWSPDSRRWAIGDESGNLTIYGTDGTTLVSARNTSGVDALAWSPDGKILAGGSVTLWTGDGTVIRRLSGISSSISALAWSPDSQWLAASSGWDNVRANDVHLWGTNFGSDRTVPLAGHTAPVASLAWSPNGTAAGSILASGSLDTTIRLWKIAAAGG